MLNKIIDGHSTDLTLWVPAVPISHFPIANYEQIRDRLQGMLADQTNLLIAQIRHDRRPRCLRRCSVIGLFVSNGGHSLYRCQPKQELALVVLNWDASARGKRTE